MRKTKEGGVFKKIRSLMIPAVYITMMCVNAHAYDHGDFQIWNSNVEDIKIGKDTKLVMEQEYRYGEDATELFYQHYDWGFLYSFDKGLDIQPGFRFILERAKRKWMESDEPYVNITPKFDIWKFRFEDRNRIEYRHFRFANDQVRYRNRFMLKYPFDFHKITITPFVSDEIFVSSNGSGFNQNRFEPGLEFGLTKYAKATVSYMQQQVRTSKTSDKWLEANVLWLKGRISF
jgi:hypothetical protein